MKTLALASLLVFLMSAADATPKFASRMNLPCSSCHVNPSGSGMRNSFGANSYGREDLPVPTWQDQFDLDGFSTQLSKFIAIGADIRTLYFYQQTGPGSSRNSFFEMQSDLYLSATIAKKVLIYLNRGKAGRYEAFGLATILPLNGYVKAGWFAPNFGLRIDDHTAFTRERTLFANGGGQDAGIEVGVSPGMFTFTASVTNGATTDRDDNGFKAVLARGDANLQMAGISLQVGGSYYNNAYSAGVTTLLGFHGTMSLGGNLTLLGEFVKKREYLNATLTKTLSNIMYVEADYVLTQGVDLKLGYEFYDPNTRFQTGTESRIVLGLEFFPLSGVEFRPQYIIRTEKPNDTPNDQFLMMMHLYL